MKEMFPDKNLDFKERYIQSSEMLVSLLENNPDCMISNMRDNFFKPPFKVCISYNNSRQDPYLIIDIDGSLGSCTDSGSSKLGIMNLIS